MRWCLGPLKTQNKDKDPRHVPFSACVLLQLASSAVILRLCVVGRVRALLAHCQMQHNISGRCIKGDIKDIYLCSDVCINTGQK